MVGGGGKGEGGQEGRGPGGRGKLTTKMNDGGGGRGIDWEWTSVGRTMLLGNVKIEDRKMLYGGWGQTKRNIPILNVFYDRTGATI